MRRLSFAALAAAVFLPSCAATSISRDLRLRRIVLYQNGLGYFERTGTLTGDKLHLQVRAHEVDDVLKTLVVVDPGATAANRKPSTATMVLPEAKKKPAARAPGGGDGEGADPDDSERLDLVLSPRPEGDISIAYAVPTAAWKAAYRVVLPEAGKPLALLQAWAVVDNISDEDWNDVNVTLATGAPFSFDTDLHSIRMMQRPQGNSSFIQPSATGPVIAERAREADRDGDGIPDISDACPDAPGGADSDVKQSGCPRRVIVSSNAIQILQQVKFDANSSKIPSSAAPVLDEIVRLLRQEPPQVGHVRLDGNASKDERDAEALSKRRAEVVYQYLVDHGVKRTLLTTAAHGASQPLDTNDTANGRASNRRVEFHLEGNEEGNVDAKKRGAVARRSAPVSPGGGGGDAPVATASVTPDSASSGSQAVATPVDGGSTIRYEIAHSITIPKRSSSMVTIINERIPGEELLLYRPDPLVPGSEWYPLRAARIENKTTLALQGGPVAVFGGGTYVGEGLIEKVEPGEHALIPYGVDSSSSVSVDSKQSVLPIRIKAITRGVATVENARILATQYTVDVGVRSAARLLVRHPLSVGYAPGKIPDGSETNPDAYLLPVALSPRKKTAVSIEERRPEESQIPLASIDGHQLELYLAGSKLPDAAAKALRDLAKLRVDMGHQNEALATVHARREELEDELASVRANLVSVEKTPGAGGVQKDMLARLSEITKRADALANDSALKELEISKAKTAVGDMLRDLVFEAK